MYRNVHSSFIQNNKIKILGVIERRGDAIFQEFEKMETATSEEERETHKKERVTGKDKLAEFSRSGARTLAHWEELESFPSFAETRAMCEAWDPGERPGR